LSSTCALGPHPDFELKRCLNDVDLLWSIDPSVLCYAHFGPAVTGGKLDVFEKILIYWMDAIEAE